MISALLEACQEILNCQIMTVMENPLRSTMVLGSLRQRTARSRLLPNLSSHQKQSELIFMQEHYFHFASSSSMSYTGLSIYDNPFFFKVCAIYTIALHHEDHLATTICICKTIYRLLEAKCDYNV
uniref:Uncharacterized protein n=1 Tax=Micrurus lemniscatus lemniscatus TaxID=129467 RepID=A0A2D4I259_MICLE